MNYEQKYKEALKVMESLYNVVKYQSSTDALLTYQTIEKAFHELKESEDEKIRKELIERFKWELKGAEEQDAAGCSRQKDIAMFKRGIAWLEKQGEQKPAEEITSNPDYISPKDKALFEISTILSQHEDKYDSPLEEIRSILVNYEINNLESNEQKPVEWSEEDEEILDGIIDTLDGLCLIDSDRINWLKSIKPNHWKPSDEQIRSLRIALQTMPYSKDKENVLVILEQLMKL